MIVYNLACEHQHPFEGWFASPADFENQRDRGLVECPLCGSKNIERKLHAPRINLGGVGGARERESEKASNELAEVERAKASDPSGEYISASDVKKLGKIIGEFATKVRENTEYVGDQFADEARAMHYGDKPHRGIRGRADAQTAHELREEGIEVQSLPFPIDFPTAH
jgi:hypothetical protein